MNKTLGTTLLVSGTMIGAGMLAMPLTSAGIGFTFTVVLLLILWALLTYSALLFVEVYQTADSDAGIGTLAALYYGNVGRVIATTVMFVFLYALLSAYISGGGEILMKAAERTGLAPDTGLNGQATLKLYIGLFTLVFGAFIVISAKVVDGGNRFFFFIMLAALLLVITVMLPQASLHNLTAMPLNNALLLSAAPIFFTSFGFHGSIPSLNKYLAGNVRALRFAIICGSLLTLGVYTLWQLATHGVLSQSQFTQILRENPTLYGLIEATRVITGSNIIAGTVELFSALALITSFLGVALGLYDCIDDMLRKGMKLNPGRAILGTATFLPPILFAWFYPDFIAALSYAGQMFAFYAVVLPVGLVWKARRRYPHLPYRVPGGDVALILALVLGIAAAVIPFYVKAGYLPPVVG